ncbi:hypothetical protein OROMI_023488 [Orobanche minor]
MAVMEYYQLFLVPLFIFLLHLFKLKHQTKGSAPTKWPVIGMMPAVVQNIHRIHDYATQVLNEVGGTLEFKGPMFSNMDMLITCDPTNINHIFTKRFSNYPKGPGFRKIFEILGDGIFSSDSELWELHRRATLALMNDDRFYVSLERTVWRKVENGLMPILGHFFEKGTDFDMQDILQRFSFDNICQFFLNYDPGSLSVDMPNVPCEKALGDALGPLFHRHIVPESLWRIQKWLKIGNEKKLIESWEAFDDFIYEHISLGRDRGENDQVNIFKSFIKAYEESGKVGYSGDLKRFLRDTFLGLLFAGRDSLSVSLTWFFWLLSANPRAETKIREEIETVLNIKKGDKWRFFKVEECDKLIYLHAALCETLRLFPPIALEIKTPTEHDILPSGHHVRSGTRIIVSVYSTGRMESVWGKDCMEFKPERWILPGGGIKHEPSFKFPAFNVGPRSCPGKKMSFIEMKMVAAVVVHHFHVRVVESHPVSPREAIMLKAKHGLRVRLSRNF